MDAAEQWYRAITNGRSPRTEGRSTVSMVAEVQRARGTNPPDGISARMWRDLRANPDRKRAPATLNVLRLAQRRTRLSLRREARLRKLDAEAAESGATAGPIRVTATVWVSSKRDKRQLPIDTYNDDDEFDGTEPLAGLLGRMLDDWLAGDDTGMIDRLNTALSDNFGQPVTLTDVTSVKLP